MRTAKIIVWSFVILVVSLYLYGCTSPVDLETGADQSGEKLLTVIMYHSIVDSQRRASTYIIRPKTLEQDLIYLREHGYRPTTVEELYNYVHGNGDLPDKTVLLTFDDGFYNNMSYAVPLLEKYGYNAVVSVVGSFADEETKLGAPQNNNYSYLTWKQIGEIGEKSFIEIGNHSYNLHGNGGRTGLVQKSGESDEAFKAFIQEDTMKVQELVKNSTGKYPTIYTYPYGKASDLAKEVVEAIGFQATLSCYEHVNKIEKGTDCLYNLGRYNRPSGISSESFFEKMTLIK